MAGVPFEPIERLATTAVSEAAREVLFRRKQFSTAKLAVQSELRSEDNVFSKKQSRIWSEAIRRDRTPVTVEAPPRSFVSYTESIASVGVAEKKLVETLREELERSRRALATGVQRFLGEYLVFAGVGVGDRLLRQLPDAFPLPPRNKEARSRERTALLYLQRICAKNDSLSAFGPCGWGSVRPDILGLELKPLPGIAQRESFLERWTAHGVVAAINSDREARMELPLRPNSSGHLDDPALKSLLERCDGKAAAHSLGIDRGLLEKLAERNLIRWEMQVPALDPYAFETLMRDISQWRNGAVRRRWLEVLQPIAALPRKFRDTQEMTARVQIMDDAKTRLDQIGAHHAASGRFLYAATNPIAEECLRECNFVISKKLIDDVAIQAAPWIDLWRDCYAFVASRVAHGLRQIFESSKSEAISLPMFLRLCETAKVSLCGPGLVALAHVAFQDVKAAFRQQIRSHTNEAEYELTAEDCHFIRRSFEYKKFDEFTYPSADLQLAANSIEAVAQGDYQWVLAELHPPVALLQHGFYWSCPNKAALSHALSATVFRQPSFHFGFFAADLTATNTVRIFDALPAWNYFLAPQRANPEWQVIRPSDAEVYVDEGSGEVVVREKGSSQYLGSFARNWIIPAGFHPFQFGMAPHMPRLRCGNVVVQRRAWTVTVDELGSGDFTGISRDLVLAVEKLRSIRDLPRFVYIRPTEQVLRRSGAEGRDKDTKPVFIDLESYLFLEIFHRWLTKAGELEVVEMLPTPDQLLWREPDGRRTFELRTLIVPRS